MTVASSSGGSSKRPGTFPRLLFAAFASTLLFAGPATSQLSASAPFVQRAEALQSELAIWRRTLSTMTFGQPSISNPSLGNRRGQCLEWIPTIRIGIARVNKKSALGQQFSLLLSLTYFDNALLNLSDALRLARTMQMSTAELAILEQDQEKVDVIRKGLQGICAELHSQFFQRLRAGTEGSQTEAGPASHQPGAISGYVYRADSGRPLADVVVTLESPASPKGDRLRQTGEDGSYKFAGLMPGNYWVVASQAGYVGEVYGIGKSQNVSEGLIRVAPGEKHENVDLRLSPVPSIRTLGGEALGKKVPGKGGQFTYGPGRFSPDGQEFAFAVGQPSAELACRYNLTSGSRACVPWLTERGPFKITDFAWSGNKLYCTTSHPGETLSAITQSGVQPASPWMTPGVHAMTPAEMRSYSALFSSLNQLFGREENHAAGTRAHLRALNSRFFVYASYGQLAMANRDGEDPYVIATGGKELYSFVFDPKKAVLFYPVTGRYHGAIVSFDLNTRRYQTIKLPYGDDLRLLDVKEEQGRTLAAYTVDGPCVPKQSASGEDPWLLPSKNQFAPKSQHACLAVFPSR